MNNDLAFQHDALEGQPLVFIVNCFEPFLILQAGWDL